MMLVRRDISECFSETERANILTPLNHSLFFFFFLDEEEEEEEHDLTSLGSRLLRRRLIEMYLFL